MEELEQYLERRAQGENPLAALLRLPAEEKQRRGVVHTPREIMQQPWAWRETARVVFERREELREFLRCGGGVDAVVLAGAGSSAHAGLSLVPLFREHGLAACDVPTTDLVVKWQDIFSDKQGYLSYLLVSLARSGDSPESTGAVDRVLRYFPRVRHLVICCNANGALPRKYRDCPNVFTLILPEATNDRSLVMTSAYTSLIVAGQCVAELERAAAYRAILEALATAAERVVDGAGVAEEVAALDPSRVCLLAPRDLLGMVREGALKILETTAGRVATLAETFLGLRHGSLVFLDERTALLYFFSSDPHSRKYEQDLADEVRAKGLGMAAVGLGPGEAEQMRYSLSQAYPEGVPDLFRSPLDALFPQMLALFLCLRLGLRPDNPSEGGVIHRVVEGVRLYGP